VEHFLVTLASIEIVLLQQPLLSAVVALVISMVAGPSVIRLLRLRLRERIASDSATLNALHASKRQTPTMGGVLIMLAFLVSLFTTSAATAKSTIIIALTALSLCLVGALDDWIKATTSRKGLTVRQKLTAQTTIALAAATALFFFQIAPADSAFSLSAWLPESLNGLYIPWAAVVIIAASNAVNLTDGLDGLAAGCTTITAITTTVIIVAAISSSGASESLTIAAASSAALAGSTAGFLWFNRFPAKVFMGDAGSLPIGGILAITALMSGTELLLLLTGAVFVAETLSVMLQVFWFRRTGRRILLCSPLHNHFVFQESSGDKDCQRVLANGRCDCDRCHHLVHDKLILNHFRAS
jgi:phospho-N-acetylmuramoyl-pentapeptide-transferase